MHNDEGRAQEPLPLPALRARRRADSGAAVALLDGYTPASPLFLASSRHTLLTRGIAERVELGNCSREALPGRVREVLRNRRSCTSSAALAVGALPFDSSAPATLVIPERAAWAGPLTGALGEQPRSSITLGTSRAFPSTEHYLLAVEKAVSRIRAGQLQKVVLARSLLLQGDADIDVCSLVRRLAAKNPAAYTFGIDLSAAMHGTRTSEPQRTLIGASPELLVSRAGLDVFTNPLAGSAARSADPVQDARRAEGLLLSAKNREEHAFVVDRVVAVLQPFCSRLRVPKRPALLRTDTMWHLSTAIHGRLLDPTICSLTLAMALHPTPAVCGTPQALALETIHDLEGFERGFYAGLLGWCTDEGDGEWIVTIRCGEVLGPQIRLFAGAGIVAQSIPAEELRETSAKLGTLLGVMNVEATQGECGGFV